jgi:hypothetical protein
MFSHLTSQLSGELQTAQKVLAVNEELRNLVVVQREALSALPSDPPNGTADDGAAYAISSLLVRTPSKLDWQIYDHCAAVTRLYAAYARFVGDLVAEFLRLLPTLYATYSDLPTSITMQHRVGIGQILLKMGEKGHYKKLEEEPVVRELAASLSGASGYTLLADAFFMDRQNLRFRVLLQLFGVLGFKHCGRYVNKHPAIMDFIKNERADSSSPMKELDDFIEYRNEAAHRKVENVLSIDAIGATGRFLDAIGRALASMVEEGVLHRHMELGHYSQVLTVSETHYDGFVAIGIPADGVTLAIGEEVLICTKNTCQRAILESLRLNGQTVESATADGRSEVGLRLTKRSSIRTELRRLLVPTGVPAEIQLNLEDAMPAMSNIADSDLVESIDSDASTNLDDNNQAESD